MLLLLLLLSAPEPRLGYYYREAFVRAVQAGKFDPDTRADAREPSVRWNFPTAVIDTGTEKIELQLRYVRTSSTTVVLETRGKKDNAWTARVHDAITKSELVTDLMGTPPQRLFRLGHDYETLSRLARDRNGAALRHRLNGRYLSDKGEEIVVDAKSLVRACLDACATPATCVEIGGVPYRLDGDRAVVEVARFPRACPQGPAIEAILNARRYVRTGR